MVRFSVDFCWQWGSEGGKDGRFGVHKQKRAFSGARKQLTGADFRSKDDEDSREKVWKDGAARFHAIYAIEMPGQ